MMEKTLLLERTAIHINNRQSWKLFLRMSRQWTSEPEIQGAEAISEVNTADNLQLTTFQIFEQGGRPGRMRNCALCEALTVSND
jgi:hypothetical protein